MTSATRVEGLTSAQRSVLVAMGNEWKRAPFGSKSATLLALEAKKLVRVRPRTHFNPDPYTSYSWQWRWTKKGEAVAAGLIFP